MQEITLDQWIESDNKHRKESVSLFEILWMISQLSPLCEKLTANKKGADLFQELARTFDLPLDKYTHFDEQQIATLVGYYFNQSRSVSELDLLVKIHQYIQQVDMDALSISLAHSLVEGLRFQVNQSNGNLLNTPFNLVVFGASGLLSAVMASVQGIKVTYCQTAKKTEHDIWLAWFTYFFPNLTLHFIEPEMFTKHLPKGDALLLMSGVSQKQTIDDPSVYRHFKNKYNLVLGLHPINFFIKIGMVADSRREFFTMTKRHDDLSNSIVTPLKLLVALPSDVYKKSKVLTQLMLVDFMHQDNGISMVDLSSDDVNSADGSLALNLEAVLTNGSREEKSLTHQMMAASCSDIYQDSTLNLSVVSYLSKYRFKTWLESVQTNPHGFSTLHQLAPAQKTSQQIVSDCEEGEGEVIYEIATGDMDAFGEVRTPNKTRYLSKSKALDVIKRFGLKPNDLLISVKSALGKVILMGEQIPHNWLPSMQMLVFRSTDQSLTVIDKQSGRSMQLTPAYLYHYLKTPMVQSYLQSLNSGATLPKIRLKDLYTIPIPHPSPEKLAQIHQLEAQRSHQLSSIYQQIEQYNQQLEKIEEALTHSK